MSDLFLTNLGEAQGPIPLAERLRPKTVEEVIGEAQLLAPDAPLGAMLASGQLTSIIFWGPPGVGKTTLARLLADHKDLFFEQISVIFSGVADLKKCFEAARLWHKNGIGTLLFVDEIHRFNRAQQDGFLPYIEDGSILLVGASTENPSFELNAALLSRAQVLVLTRLSDTDLMQLMARTEAVLSRRLPLTAEAKKLLITMADGDGRMLLNLIEQTLAWPDASQVGVEALASRLSRKASQYNKSGDGHYNLISALHKSVRGSDPDAALYWLARMLEGGEDPRYLGRRMLRMAIEDIGLADPGAQRICIEASQIYERLGSPEGELALAQAVAYIALAPKSNAIYAAYKAARCAALSSGSPPPPKHILNAPTEFMKDQGYGTEYVYDHDAPDGFSGQDYFPEELGRLRFYEPVERGFERDLIRRIAYFDKLRARRLNDR